MSGLFSLIQTCNKFLWNGPMLFLLMGTHLFFTVRTKGVQRRLPLALRLSVHPSDRTSSGMSIFASLSTTLAATLGTGNIIGISTAIALGGPGAVFWCWLTGVLGMATTYTECRLSLAFRKTRNDGSFCGGPMYLLHNELHAKKTARCYAYLLLASSFCVGCSTQSQAVTQTLFSVFQIPVFPSGLLLSVLLCFALLGGIKSISRICTVLVPLMGTLYLLACSFLLFLNRDYLFPAIVSVFSSAFSLSSFGGGLLGSSFLLSARYGIARGLFTNEAGLGSAPVAAANSGAETESQALVLMSATFWDTVVMCGVTGIVIISSMLRCPGLISGYGIGDYTLAAFSLLPFAGRELLAAAIVSFAVATLLGWSFFGEKAAEFLFGNDQIKTYRLLYCFMIFLGSQMSLSFVWELSDFFNALMILPNVLSLFLLQKFLPQQNPFPDSLKKHRRTVLHRLKHLFRTLFSKKSSDQLKRKINGRS